MLRVGAANYEARAFLNGVFMGSHRGGSTPFFIELTGHSTAGENRLQIQVHNRRLPDRVPKHHVDWFNYSSIYREVSLLVLPGVFIQDFGLALATGGIAVDVELSQPVDGVARLDIPGLGVACDLSVTASAGRAVVAASPEL